MNKNTAIRSTITSIAGRPLSVFEAKQAAADADPDEWARQAHLSGAIYGDSLEKTKRVHKSGLVPGQLWDRLMEYGERHA